jgi:hypothetical protein
MVNDFIIIFINNFIICYIFLNYYHKLDIKNKNLEKKIAVLIHQLSFVLNEKSIDELENKLNEVEPNNFIEKAFTFLFEVLKKIYNNEVKPREPYILPTIIVIFALLRIASTLYLFLYFFGLPLLYILLYMIFFIKSLF